MIPTSIPHGRTARRLEWRFLPREIRVAVERRLGSPVVGAESQTAGFTPGFASVLTCVDGTRHFVKAASVKAQRAFANAYRDEARRLRALPPSAPAPRLKWVHDADDWVVLGIEYVDARPPHRPWTAPDLAAASDMLVSAAADLTPAPGLDLASFEEEVKEWPSYWDHLRGGRHADEAASLAARFTEAVGGDTLVHGDVRDDNLLYTADGRVLLCDWNYPSVGAAWLDSFFLLLGPRGDGLDVDAHIAGHPQLSRVDPEHLDIVLALACGYFLHMSTFPVPSNSPYVREVQRWQGEVVWEWLAERRGWE